VRPLERLARLGLLGPISSACMRCIWMTPKIDLLAQFNCHVAHCPSSNLKLASGFARLLD